MPTKGEEIMLELGCRDEFGVSMEYAGLIGKDTFSIIHLYRLPMWSNPLYFPADSKQIIIDRHVYEVLDLRHDFIRLKYVEDRNK